MLGSCSEYRESTKNEKMAAFAAIFLFRVFKGHVWSRLMAIGGIELWKYC